MKNYEYVFFDLDGTLTESGPGIKASIRHVFETYNIDYSAINLDYFIGPPLQEEFVKIFKTEEKADEAIDCYRKHYDNDGLLSGNSVYEGIFELLEFLKVKGYKIGVVTSKPEKKAKKVVEHFKLNKYIDKVYGPDKHGENAEKYEILMEALKELNCTAENALMIGDRKFDLLAAKKANVDAIAALYGYGSLEELSSYKNIFLAKNPLEIKAWFSKV